MSDSYKQCNRSMKFTAASRRARRVTCGALAALAGVGGLAGCETDSFIDPSVVGRWENTPTVMPILDRISAIEEETADMVKSEPVQPEDLIPEIEQYRFGPSDSLEIVIRDFITPGQDEKYQPVNLDSRGYIYIPNLKPIRAQGHTNLELVEMIKQAVEDAQIRAAANTVVSVNILSQRSQTFAVIGAVAKPDEYFISQPNYRLLNALTTAGGFSETIEKIYVIRQAPLSDAAAGRSASEPVLLPNGAPVTPPPVQDPNKLIDLINEIGKPQGGATPPPTPKPGMMRGASRGQPEAKKPAEAQPPAIDLPGPKGTPTAGDKGPDSDWVYENGQWVKKSPGAGAAATAAGAGSAAGGTAHPAVTQRVIEIPTDRLIAGDASVNIVIRPGDVVRVPSPKTGVVYVGGQVSRPGPYGLSSDSKLTILRGMISAGGLGSIAIPERVDITRIVGPGRQATIRLNLRAIGEQTQPDIYLKPDDMINVGTNFWALPLAVIRGGFRASYGYGFILDRNFDSEIFGPYQTSNR